ncbi:regulating synaptic membrane exocytosis protein 2 [Periophthalmus magnuspinnatus]|uniref:regulating synaptic membrane exocytosis protein 2 n=1 Tax=Periophthalmus magnuspinnatus TaxID=409849 RepID=UPI00243641CA|nr:regulating synaptic membrane exocytosis protein 2 [Periophthalmus magnuspinnatus]
MQSQWWDPRLWPGPDPGLELGLGPNLDPSPVSWLPSVDGQRLIGRIILNKTLKDGTTPRDTGALLGLKVVGGKMTDSGRLCAFITKVKKGSLADTVGHLRPGDQVLQWNGRVLQGATFSEVYDIIQESQNQTQVQLLVQRDLSLNQDLNRDMNQDMSSSSLESVQKVLSCPVSPTVSLNISGSQRTLVPRIQVKLWLDSVGRQLIVTILGAKELPCREDHRPRNPYVNMYLLPDRSDKSRRRTKTVRKSTEPRWSQTFIYGPVLLRDLTDRTLELTVWDQTRVQEQTRVLEPIHNQDEESQLLGQVLVRLEGALLDDQPHWYKLQLPQISPYVPRRVLQQNRSLPRVRTLGQDYVYEDTEQDGIGVISDTLSRCNGLDFGSSMSVPDQVLTRIRPHSPQPLPHSSQTLYPLLREDAVRLLRGSKLSRTQSDASAHPPDRRPMRRMSLAPSLDSPHDRSRSPRLSPVFGHLSRQLPLAPNRSRNGELGDTVQSVLSSFSAPPPAIRVQAPPPATHTAPTYAQAPPPAAPPPQAFVPNGAPHWSYSAPPAAAPSPIPPQALPPCTQAPPHAAVAPPPAPFMNGVTPPIQTHAPITVPHFGPMAPPPGVVPPAAARTPSLPAAAPPSPGTVPPPADAAPPPAAQATSPPAAVPPPAAQAPSPPAAAPPPASQVPSPSVAAPPSAAQAPSPSAAAPSPAAQAPSPAAQAVPMTASASPCAPTVPPPAPPVQTNVPVTTPPVVAPPCASSAPTPAAPPPASTYPPTAAQAPPPVAVSSSGISAAALTSQGSTDAPPPAPIPSTPVAPPTESAPPPAQAPPPQTPELDRRSATPGGTRKEVTWEDQQKKPADEEAPLKDMNKMSSSLKSLDSDCTDAPSLDPQALSAFASLLEKRRERRSSRAASVDLRPALEQPKEMTLSEKEGAMLQKSESVEGEEEEEEEPNPTSGSAPMQKSASVGGEICSLSRNDDDDDDRKRRSSLGQKMLGMVGLGKKSQSTTNLNPEEEEKKKKVIRLPVQRSIETGLAIEFKAKFTRQASRDPDAEDPKPGALIFPGVKIAADKNFTGFLENLGPAQVAGRQTLATPPMGDIQLGMVYRKERLDVEVIRARGLMAKHGNKNTPAAYVKVYLMDNGKCVLKRRTRLSRKTLDPLYQQQLQFEENPEGKVLQVIVWGDYGRMDHKSFMGAAQVLLDDLDLSNMVIGWFKLFPAISLVDPGLAPLTNKEVEGEKAFLVPPPAPKPQVAKT